MVTAPFTVSAADLGLDAASRREPILFIDLAAEPDDVPGLQLPACPVIGLGSAAHPLAARLDAVIASHCDGEGPDPASILAAAQGQPHASAIVAQLLRILPELTVRQGLVAESLAYATLQGSAAHREWQAGRIVREGQRPGTVRLEREAAVLFLTLDRPWAGNAIDRPMRDALCEGFALANADPTIERVVVRAEGKAFSLGADLSEFGTTGDPATAHMIRCLTLPAREAIGCAARTEVHVHGGCVGAGLELAAFAGRITATRRAWFQLPELAMGILPGAGGCVSVSRRIGRQRTLLMILSGRRISATRALEWGLVDELT